MRKLWFLLLAGPALAAEHPVESARKALGDGLPQVAIHRLSPAEINRLPAAEREAATLLRGQALFAAGRPADAARTLDALNSPEASFWKAEACAALDSPGEAARLYEAASRDPQFAGTAALGRARMLAALGQVDEAGEILEKLLESGSARVAAALDLAAVRIDAGNYAAALQTIPREEDLSPSQRRRADYLAARALLGQGEAAAAEERLRRIQVPSADEAARVAVALADCRLRQSDAADAEKILEVFIEENPRLAGLGNVFAALDRVYFAQGAASGAELRRWAEDKKEPHRVAFALYYQARNEARLSKAEKSRELFREFLAAHPNHPLAENARTAVAESLITTGRARDALKLLEGISDAPSRFLRGQALAASSNWKEAATAFLEASASPAFALAALANAAVCEDRANISNPKAIRRLRDMPEAAATLERVAYLHALRLAAERRPDAEKALREIAESGSRFAPQARLTLVEWLHLQTDLPGARSELRRIANQGPETAERADFLAIFLADTGEADAEARVEKLAQAYLETHPNSPQEADVRMKLGEVLYRRGDYQAARSEFEIVAERFPASPLAEKAIYFSAQAMARSLESEAMENAIEAYEEVVKRGGPLSLRARFAQAGLLNALEHPKEALAILDRILESKPEPDLRYAVQIERGDTLFSQASRDPGKYREAILAWKAVADDPAAPKSARHQALAKMGAAHEKLGDPDAALDCYYDVFSENQKGEPEYFWFYKAGFDAGRLLESRKLWKEAISVYGILGAVNGPRAVEARDRVKKLRLENFIWED